MILVDCPMCRGAGCGRCDGGRLPAVDAAVLTAEIYAPAPRTATAHAPGIAGLIRAARVRRGLSQQGLADLLDGALSTVSAYERGARQPSPRRLEQLERVLGPLEVES